MIDSSLFSKMSILEQPRGDIYSFIMWGLGGAASAAWQDLEIVTPAHTDQGLRRLMQLGGQREPILVG